MAFIGSCSGKVLPAPGELMIAVTTDMQPGKDFDTLYVDVLENGTYRYQGYDVFPSPVGPGAQHMPATIALVSGHDPTIPAFVRVIATKGDPAVVQVLRQATVTVPTDRIAMLEMPLQWLCTGPGPSGPTQTAPSRLGEPPTVTQCNVNGNQAQTCVAGSCQNAAFTDVKLFPKRLPDYKPESVFGGGSGDGTGSCFDVLECFHEPTLADVAENDCTIPNPGGTPNVALFVGTRGDDSPGICGPSDTSPCFIPLDGPSNKANLLGSEAALIGDTPSGWTNQGARIQLPGSVCERLKRMKGEPGRIIGVVTTTTCPTKAAGTPTCGPWSSTNGGVKDAGAPRILEAGAPSVVVPTDAGPPKPLVSEPGKTYAGGVLGFHMVVAAERVFWWTIQADDAGNQIHASIESVPTTGAATPDVLGTYRITSDAYVVGLFTEW